MRTLLLSILLACMLPIGSTQAASPATLEMLSVLEPQAERPFSAEEGRATWYREVDGRSCLSCHGESLKAKGRHEKTGKVIEPMAPSVNPERLTEVKKIKKWFLRNCKWTYGRECTPQEKGDVLVWLSDQ